MMRFIWDQRYSVGIKSIDKQHQRFFEIINEIGYLTYSQNLNLTELKNISKELLEYAKMHLQFEEDIFRKINYSDTKKHCQAHDTYRLAMKKFTSRLDDPTENATKLAQEMADFARDWLSAHILSEDTKYMGEFLTSDVK